MAKKASARDSKSKVATKAKATAATKVALPAKSKNAAKVVRGKTFRG
jgi:hypothetical protein